MKKGQLDYPVASFFVVVFILLLLSPFILKIFNEVRGGFGDALGNMSIGGASVAQDNFNAVIDTGINFWDKVIVAAFVISLIVLIISAFLIDSSPFWVIIYIFLSFLLIVFAQNITGALDAVYGNVNFATEVNQLPLVDAIRQNFISFLVGVQVICGIIIYGKIRFFGSEGGPVRR